MHSNARSCEGLRVNVNPYRTNPRQREKINLNFHFDTFFCGGSKGFIKASKACIKPFEAPQGSVKIKIYVNFYFNTTF